MIVMLNRYYKFFIIIIYFIASVFFINPLIAQNTNDNKYTLMFSGGPVLGTSNLQQTKITGFGNTSFLYNINNIKWLTHSYGASFSITNLQSTNKFIHALFYQVGSVILLQFKTPSLKNHLTSYILPFIGFGVGLSYLTLEKNIFVASLKEGVLAYVDVLVGSIIHTNLSWLSFNINYRLNTQVTLQKVILHHVIEGGIVFRF